MKKILICVLMLAVLVTAFVSCKEEETAPDLTALNNAKSYLEAQYRDASDMGADYERTTVLPGNCTVAWSVNVTSGNAEDVKVGEAADGKVVIDINEVASVDTVYTLIATITDANGNSTTVEFAYTVAKTSVITVAEFLAKTTEDKTEYAIEGYVMASAASATKGASFVVADSTGAIFSYEKFIVAKGDKVIVKGSRSDNYGVPQIKTTAVSIVEANSTGYQEATAIELAAADIDLAGLKKETIGEMTGKYYKVTGATLIKNKDGYTNAELNGKEMLQLYPSDALVAEIGDLYGETVNVYGYVRGYKTGEYLTLQVSNIEYGGEGEFVPKTPAERVATEKDSLKIDNVCEAGTVELPTAGETFGNVSISWALAANTVATLAGNKLTVAELPAEKTNITLTATLTCGEVTDTKEITIYVRTPWAALENKVEGITLSTYAELAQAAKDESKDKLYTIGWIVKIEKEYYGNVYIKNADGEEFYVYGIYSLDGKRFGELDNMPIVGDVVVLHGGVSTYKNNPQMKDATLLQVNGTVCVAETPEEPEVPGDTVTTIAGALAAAEGTNVELTGTVSEIYQPWNPDYNNMSYYLTDGTSTILVFRAGGVEVKVTDTVKIVGKVTVYNDVNQIAQGGTTTLIEEGEGPATPEVPEGALVASKTMAEIATANEWSNSTQYASFTLDEVVTVSSVGGSNTGKYYENGSSYRIYATDSPAGTLTISVAEGYELVSVKVTCTTGNYAYLCAGEDTATDLSNTTIEATGSSIVLNSVRNGEDGKHVRVTAIEVVYKAVEAAE